MIESQPEDYESQDNVVGCETIRRVYEVADTTQDIYGTYKGRRHERAMLSEPSGAAVWFRFSQLILLDDS